MDDKLEMMKRELENMKKKIIEQEAKIAAEEFASKCEHDWEEPKLIKDRFGRFKEATKEYGYMKEYTPLVNFMDMLVFDSATVFQRKCKKCGKVEQTNRFITKYVPQWNS